MTKTKYTKEFKEMSVELSYNQDKPVSQTARELGINQNVLHKWRKETNPEQIKKEPDEIKQMKRRISELEVQNEILKKALAICNKI